MHRRIRQTICVAAFFLVASLIPFLTLVFLPDKQPTDLPQTRVLKWSEPLKPKNTQRYKNQYSVVEWNYQPPADNASAAILLNGQHIPLVSDSDPAVTFQKIKPWDDDYWVKQLCEVGGLASETDSIAMYASVLRPYHREGEAEEQFLTLRSYHSGEQTQWELSTKNRQASGSQLLLSLTISPHQDIAVITPDTTGPAGEAPGIYWRLRIAFAVWLYAAIVLPVLFFVVFYLVFTFAAFVCTLLITLFWLLLKIGLGVLGLCMLVLMFSVLREQRRRNTVDAALELPLSQAPLIDLQEVESAPGAKMEVDVEAGDAGVMVDGVPKDV